MTEACTKAICTTRKWAIVTLHSWLPALSEQIARARAWGVEESNLQGVDISAVFTDDVRKVKRTTNWAPYLTERFSFIARARQLDGVTDGSSVFFATPLCVGFSEKLAQQTVAGLHEVGMQVYVHSIGALYRKGDDLTEFLAGVGLDANAAHARATRARKSNPAPVRKRRSVTRTA